MKINRVVHWILVLLLFLTIPSTAQRINFTDTSNLWRTTHTAFPNGPPGYTGIANFHIKDTLVEVYSHTYASLRSDNGVFDVLVREDTISKKVYIRPVTWYYQSLEVPDTGELVYMDYSLGVGDTLAMPLTVCRLCELSYSRRNRLSYTEWNSVQKNNHENVGNG